MYWQAHRCKAFWAATLGQNVLFILFFVGVVNLFPENQELGQILTNWNSSGLLVLALFNLASLPMSIIIAKRVEKYTEIVFKGELLDQIRHDTRNSIWGAMQIARKCRGLISDEFPLLMNYLEKIETVLADPETIKKLWRAKKDVTFVDHTLKKVVIEANHYSQTKFKSNEIEIINKEDSDYGLFTLVNDGILHRVLENVFNNALDSISTSEKKEKGTITIQTKEGTEFHQIIIEDNGKGLDKKQQGKVFERGFSYDKINTGRSGTGQGLSWAKEQLTSLNGDIQFESKPQIGAIITITLPKGNGPKWFCSKVNMANINHVCVIDDSKKVSKKWEDKFSDLKIFMDYFKDQKELEKGIATLKKENLKNTLFLVDYDYEGHDYNGIDLILMISKFFKHHPSDLRVLLVTDKVHNTQIYKDCKSYEIPLLPKSSIEKVPLFLPNVVKADIELKALVLDDDGISLECLVDDFKDLGLSCFFSTFTDSDSFLEISKSCSKDIEIFLDDRLGEGKKRGSVLGQELIENGYKNVTLLTGASTSELNEMNLKGFKEIIEKTNPQVFYDRLETICQEGSTSKMLN